MAGMFDLPSWIYNSSAYQTVILDGIIVPGATTISEVERTKAIQANKERGTSGEQPIIDGLTRPKFEIKSLLREGTEEQQMLSAMRQWEYEKDPRQVNTLTVYHPFLAEIGVVNCLIEKVKITLSGPGGYKQYIITCVGVSIPKKGASKKAASKVLNIANPGVITVNAVALPPAGTPSLGAVDALANGAK